MGSPWQGKRMERMEGREWEPHLLEAHELRVIKDEEDAKDEEPGNDVQHKAQQGHPGSPGLGLNCPQHRASGDRLPASHHQLEEDEGLGDLDRLPLSRLACIALPIFTISITNTQLVEVLGPRI